MLAVDNMFVSLSLLMLDINMCMFQQKKAFAYADSVCLRHERAFYVQTGSETFLYMHNSLQLHSHVLLPHI